MTPPGERVSGRPSAYGRVRRRRHEGGDEAVHQVHGKARQERRRPGRPREGLREDERQRQRVDGQPIAPAVGQPGRHGPAARERPPHAQQRQRHCGQHPDGEVLGQQHRPDGGAEQVLGEQFAVAVDLVAEPFGEEADGHHRKRAGQPRHQDADRSDTARHGFVALRSASIVAPSSAPAARAARARAGRSGPRTPLLASRGLPGFMRALLCRSARPGAERVGLGVEAPGARRAGRPDAGAEVAGPGAGAAGTGSGQRSRRAARAASRSAARGRLCGSLASMAAMAQLLVTAE